MAMDVGQTVTVWTARAAAGVFVVAVVLLLRRDARRARIASTLGLAAYLVHVWAAFTYFYAWSHEVAYRETARQTAELFGLRWGGGLYLNYLFTGVWVVDCAGSWLRFWERRSAGVRMAAYAFMSFMVVNGTIVVWLLRALRRH
jgi:hypothetical protein